MSDIDRAIDGRRLPIFIHAELDDLPLTPNAFRVYAHIARRAGSDNNAWPSYNTIAEKCLRPAYPKAKDASLRRMAMKAVAELVDFGLIRKIQRSDEERGNRSNVYMLTERDAWTPPGDNAPAPLVTTHPPGDNAPAGDDTPPGDNAPKVTPNEVTPNEVNPQGSNPQQQGGPGGGGGPDDSGGVLGVSSKTEGGGQGEGVADIPAHIADQWVELFGEMTQEQTKFLANQLRAKGAGMVDYALGITADNMAAGTEVRKPALYVKTIITKRIADGDFGPAAAGHRRMGETESAERRKAYQL